MKKHYLLILLLLGIALAGELFAVQGRTIEVQIDEEGFHFQPKSIRNVYSGDHINFTNIGDKPHFILSESHQFESGILNPGNSFEYILPSTSPYPRNTPRGFSFHDTYNPESIKQPVVWSHYVEALILFPRDSWMLKEKAIDILFLFPFSGISFPTTLIPGFEVIELMLDNKIIFKGSSEEFSQLDYVHFEGIYPILLNNFTTYGRGAYIITVPANFLSLGKHSITIIGTLFDNTKYKDEVHYSVISRF